MSLFKYICNRHLTPSSYQNSVLSDRAAMMLYKGLSQTSSLCTHSTAGSYCDSQPWSRSRSRTSSGFASPQACSDPPAGNRASRPTEEEETEGRLASSPLAIFSPLCYVVVQITGYGKVDPSKAVMD